GGAKPRGGTRPNVGLWANTPQQCAGIRNDPFRSEPSSSDTKPAASAAAPPPEEPPGVRAVSHGLLVVPYTSLAVCPKSPSMKGTLVLPTTIAPACLSRRTTVAS